MSLNVVFFSWSTYLIHSTKFKIGNKSTSRADFYLFTRLTLIMGLKWLTGLIAYGYFLLSYEVLQEIFHLRATSLFSTVTGMKCYVARYTSKREMHF
jgi:hypothetical protein